MPHFHQMWIQLEQLRANGYGRSFAPIPTLLLMLLAMNLLFHSCCYSLGRWKHDRLHQTWHSFWSISWILCLVALTKKIEFKFREICKFGVSVRVESTFSKSWFFLKLAIRIFLQPGTCSLYGRFWEYKMFGLHASC